MGANKAIRGEKFERLYCADTGEEDQLLDGLFQRYDLLRSFNGLAGLGVLVISSSDERVIDDCIRRLGGESVVLGSFIEARTFPKDLLEPDFVFAVMSAEQNTAAFVKEMMSFRHLHPDTPIVWMSPSFRRDELDPSRPRLCEAAVGLPLTDQRLKLALAAAIWNQQRRFLPG